MENSISHMPDSQVYKGLNSLRGQACLCVFLSHLSYAFSDYIYLGTLGHVGVMIFFVMSGFLAYDKHRDFDCLRDGFKYAFKKWKHIFPLYAICTISIAVPVTLLAKSSLNKIIFSLLIHIPMLQSWIPLENELTFNSVDWYLSVMMFCWLMGPFAFKMIKKAEGSQAKILLGVACLWCTRIILYYISDSLFAEKIMINNWLMYMFPVTRFIDYLIGSYTAMYVSLNSKHRVSSPLKVFLVCILTLSYYLIPLKCDEVVFLLPLACILVVFCASSQYKGNFMNNILSIVSKYSEHVFLIHYVMVWYVLRIAKNIGIGILSSVIIIIISTIMGVAMYSVILKNFKSLMHQRRTV